MRPLARTFLVSVRRYINHYFHPLLMGSLPVIFFHWLGLPGLEISTFGLSFAPKWLSGDVGAPPTGRVNRMALRSSFACHFSTEKNGFWAKKKHEQLCSWKITPPETNSKSTWKWWVFNRNLLFRGLFSGAMLVSGSVTFGTQSHGGLVWFRWLFPFQFSVIFRFKLLICAVVFLDSWDPLMKGI